MVPELVLGTIEWRVKYLEMQLQGDRSHLAELERKAADLRQKVSEWQGELVEAKRWLDENRTSKSPMPSPKSDRPNMATR